MFPTHAITSLDQLAEHDLALPTGFLQPWPMAQCRTERPETTLLFADPAAPPYHLPCAGRGAVRTGGGARGAGARGGGAGGGGAADEAQEPRRGGRGMGRGTEARKARKRSLPSSGAFSPGPSKRAAGARGGAARAGSAASGSAVAAAGLGRQGSRRAEEVREELQAVRCEQRDVEIARERLEAKAVRLRLKEQELAAELQQHLN